jgi:hypothetical protein
MVQSAAEAFGPAELIQRTRTSAPADVRKLVASAFGYVVSIAAHRGKSTFDEALADVVEQLRSHPKAKDFEKLYRIKSIQRGHNPDRRETEADGKERVA